MWLLAGHTLCSSRCLSAKQGVTYVKTEGLALWELAEDTGPAAYPHFISDATKTASAVNDPQALPPSSTPDRRQSRRS